MAKKQFGLFWGPSTREAGTGLFKEPGPFVVDRDYGLGLADTPF